MVKPYKLKHIPTGLYYQPHKHRGSHLSKKGKIYQTSINALSQATRYANRGNIYNTMTIRVNCEYNSQIYNLTKDILSWITPNPRYGSIYYGQVKADTLLKDWIIEEI